MIEKLKRKLKDSWLDQNEVIIPFLNSLTEQEIINLYNKVEEMESYDANVEVQSYIQRKIKELYGITPQNESTLSDDLKEIKSKLDLVFSHELYASYIKKINEKKLLDELKSKYKKLEEQINDKKSRGESTAADEQLLDDLEKNILEKQRKFETNLKQALISSEQNIKEKFIIASYKEKTSINPNEISQIIEKLKKYSILDIFDSIGPHSTSQDLYKMYINVKSKVSLAEEILNLYKESHLSSREINKVIALAIKYNQLSLFDSLRNPNNDKIEKTRGELDSFFESFAKTVKLEHIKRMCNLSDDQQSQQIITEIENCDLYDLYEKMKKSTTSNINAVQRAATEQKHLEMALGSIFSTQEEKDALHQKIITIRKKSNDKIPFLNAKIVKGSLKESVYAELRVEYERIIREEELKKDVARQQILDFIKEENIPHTLEVIARANYSKELAEGLTQEQEEKEMQRRYTVSCMLKAFAIEYTLKGIDVMSNISADDVEDLYRMHMEYEKVKTSQASTQVQIKEAHKKYQQQLDNKMNQYMRRVREKLKETEEDMSIEEAKNAIKSTGHEINDILTRLLPETIQLLIREQSIVNFADENIRDNGIIPNDIDSYGQCFLANYFLSIKDIESVEMQKNTIVEHQLVYERNSKAFEEYRYQAKEAGLLDEQMLNCLMASSFLVQNYLLEHQKIATKFEENEIVSKDIACEVLTENEYNSLLAMYQDENSNQKIDFNLSVYYHMFLKHYLQDRTPKMNDERYARVNKFFEMVKETAVDDITMAGEQFAQWISSIDISTLSKEELDEIKIFNPKFIFKSLGYYDKIIYKKCEAKGINYEYYYSINGDIVEEIIDNHAEYFKEKSIPIDLFSIEKSKVSEYISLFKECNLNIENIPSYYYLYEPHIILNAYDQCKNLPTQHFRGQIISNEFLTSLAVNDLAMTIMATESFSDVPFLSVEGPLEWQEWQSISQHLTNQIDNEIRIRNGIINKYQNLIEKITSGTITSRNYEEFGYSQKEYEKATLIRKLKEKHRIANIEIYIDLSIEELRQQLDVLSLNRRKLPLAEGERTATRKKIKSSEIDEQNRPLFFSIKAFKAIGRLSKSLQITSDMKLLSATSVLKNFRILHKNNIKLKHIEYILFKTQSEIDFIIKICKENNIKFQEEMLCYKTELFSSSTIGHIWSFIEGLKNNKNLTVEEVYNIINSNQSHQKFLSGLIEQGKINEEQKEMGRMLDEHQELQHVKEESTQLINN